MDRRAANSAAKSVQDQPGGLSETMMADLGCQFDYIRNHLKPTQMWTSVKEFLHWDRRSHLKFGVHLLVAAHIKRQRRRIILLWACLPSLSLASSSILLLMHIKTFFRIPTYISKSSSSVRWLRYTTLDLDCWASLMDWTSNFLSLSVSQRQPFLVTQTIACKSL